MLDQKQSAISRLNDYLDDDDISPEIKRLLAIDPSDLDAELRGQPLRYTMWALRSGEAYVERETAERQLKILEADLYAEWRAVLESNHADGMGGKPTEKMVEAAWRGDPRYQKAITALDELRGTAMVLLKLEQGLEQRMTALQSLAATERKAMAGDR